MRSLEAKDRVLVIGSTGFGKSWYVAHEIVAKAGRVDVFDAKAEYSSKDYAGLTAVAFDEWIARRGLLDEGYHRIATQPTWRTPEDLSLRFGAWTSILSTHNPKSGLLVAVIEECGALRKYANEYLEWIACQSRAWNVPAVFVGQRAVHVSPTVREQASLVVAFRQQGTEDLKALVERFGPDFERCSDLGVGQYVLWDQREQIAAAETNAFGRQNQKGKKCRKPKS